MDAEPASAQQSKGENGVVFTGRSQEPTVDELKQMTGAEGSTFIPNEAQARKLYEDDQSKGFFSGGFWSDLGKGIAGGVNSVGKSLGEGAYEVWSDLGRNTAPRLGASAIEGLSRGFYDMGNMVRMASNKAWDHFTKLSPEEHFQAYYQRLIANKAAQQQREQGLDGKGNLTPDWLLPALPYNQVSEFSSNVLDPSFVGSLGVSSAVKSAIKHAATHGVQGAIAKAAPTLTAAAVKAAQLPAKIAEAAPTLTALAAKAAQLPGKAAERVANTAVAATDKLGAAAQFVGELPEKLIEKTAEKMVGPAYAEKAAQTLTNVGAGAGVVGALGPLGTTIAGAKGLKVAGQGLQSAADAGRHLMSTTFDPQFSRLKQVAANPDAADWLKVSATFLDSLGVEKGARFAKDVAKSTAHGAAFGAGIGALTAENPEELGASIGSGGTLGYGMRLATHPWQKKAKVWESDAQNVTEMVARQLANGADPELMARTITDDVMVAAARLQKAFGRSLDIRFVNGAEYAAKGGGDGTAGFFRDGDKPVVLVNMEGGRNLADTFYHEVSHAIMASEAANSPHIRSVIDSAIGDPARLQAAAREYSERLVVGRKDAELKKWRKSPEYAAEVDAQLKSAPLTPDATPEQVASARTDAERAVQERKYQQYEAWKASPEYQATIDAELASQQHRSTVDYGDSNAWIYGEIFADAGIGSLKGKHIYNDVIRSPGLTDLALSAGRKILSAIGVRTETRPGYKSLFTNLDDVLDSPALRKLTYGYIRELNNRLPGITEVKEKAVPVTKEMVGKEGGPLPLHKQADGTVGNDFVVQTADGKVRELTPKEVRKTEEARAKEVEAAMGEQPVKPIGDPNPEVAPRAQVGGGVAVTGTKMPAWFAALQKYSEDHKGYAKLLEEAIASGTPVKFIYHAISTSGGMPGGWARNLGKTLGNLSFTEREGIPIAIVVTKKGTVSLDGGKAAAKGGNVLFVMLDLTTFEKRATELQAGGKLDPLWNGDKGEFRKDFVTYLKNHSEGRPGEDGIGQAKRDFINTVVIGRNVANMKANPLREALTGKDRVGIIRSFRLDRMETVKPGDAPLARGEYQKKVLNLTPDSTADEVLDSALKARSNPAAHPSPIQASPAVADDIQLKGKGTLPYSVGPIPLRLIHYSGRQNLKTLDPKYFGKGSANPRDLRGGNKSYLFLEGSDFGQDEALFNNKYAYGAVVDGSRFYDLRAGKSDPLGYFSMINREAADDMLRDAGYAGLVVDTNDKRTVAMTFPKIALTPLGQGEGGTKAVAPKGARFSPDIDSEYLDAVNSGDMEKAQQMVNKAAEESGLPIVDDSGSTAFRVRRTAPPQKTVKAYKLFSTNPKRPGELFPLFVGANQAIPTGVWLDALPGPESKTGGVKSKLGDLAFRPGWHAGDTPLATHIGVKGPDGNVYARRANEVWGEVEVAADKDYQPQARQNGVNPKTGKFSAVKADIKQMPADGMYRYKTNPNMTGEWIISGSMKVNKILSEAEVNKILTDAGQKTMPWDGGGLDLAKLGLKEGETDGTGKLLDPVTKDDQGNVIPLSERFNPEVSDARYSPNLDWQEVGTDRWRAEVGGDRFEVVPRGGLYELQQKIAGGKLYKIGSASTPEEAKSLISEVLPEASNATPGKFWVRPDGSLMDASGGHEVAASDWHQKVYGEPLKVQSMDRLAGVYDELAGRNFLRAQKEDGALYVTGRRGSTFESLPRGQRAALEDAATAQGLRLVYNDRMVYDANGAYSMRFSPNVPPTQEELRARHLGNLEEQKNWPESIPLELALAEDGSIRADNKGKLMYKKIPYGMMNAPAIVKIAEDVEAKYAPKHLAAQKQVEAQRRILKKADVSQKPRIQEQLDKLIAKREALKAQESAEVLDKGGKHLGKLLYKEYLKVKDIPAIVAGKGWYADVRERFQKAFGATLEMFGQLLGATSANTDVESNLNYALEAMRMYSRGDFDTLLDSYDKHREAGGDPASWGQLPTKEDGQLFGMNSAKVLDVLYGDWLERTKGPKTPNFAGNLTGRTFEATIDVWAARMVRRLLYSKDTPQWRITPQQENGVSYGRNKEGEYGGDFVLAQKGFRYAAEKAGLEPDDMQAILWFAEKDLWDKKDWTEAAGKKKGDFRAVDLSGSVRAQAGVTTARKEFLPPEYPGARKEQRGIDIGVFEKERQDLRRAIGKMPGLMASRVNASDGMFMFEREPTFDVEATFHGSDALPHFEKQIFDLGQRAKQEDVFASYVVDQNHPNARPGMEVGFKSTLNRAQTAPIIKAFMRAGIDGFTIAKDTNGRILGIRMQYIPEISGRYDSVHLDPAKYAENAKAWLDNVDKARVLLDADDKNKISYAKTTYFDTRVFGQEEYAKGHQYVTDPTVAGELARRAAALRPVP
jgi:hypothetical protein